MSGKNPALSGVEGGKAQAEPGTTQVGHVHSGSGVWFSSVQTNSSKMSGLSQTSLLECVTSQLRYLA